LYNISNILALVGGFQRIFGAIQTFQRYFEFDGQWRRRGLCFLFAVWLVRFFHFFFSFSSLASFLGRFPWVVFRLSFGNRLLIFVAFA
jgi:hypothetical protein